MEMTLTNEQYIEVAEKLWGFVRKYDDQDKRYMWFGPDDGFEDRYLQEEINSWQGFGRTVEAMAERNFVLITHPEIGFCLAGLKEYNGGKVRNVEPEEIIEATHLASLEVINDE